MPAKKYGNQKATVPTSVRITANCRKLWDALSESTGLSNTGVLETAIRRMAKEEGIQLTELEVKHNE